VYCLYLFAHIACFQLLTLGVDDLEIFQELNEQEFEKPPAGNLGK
jgi:hypothetical protein